MNISPLTDSLSVAEQIQLADLDALKSAGFECVINNRPDGEGPNQPSSEAFAARAAELGLAYHYIPVIPRNMSHQNIDDFKAVIEGTPAKTLAFCRSGGRSTTLWAMSRAGQDSADSILSTTKAAGFNLDILRPHLG